MFLFCTVAERTESAGINRHGVENKRVFSYVEGLANHDGPESCASSREGAGEALTGVHMGRVLSCENRQSQGADAVVGYNGYICHRSLEIK